MGTSAPGNSPEGREIADALARIEARLDRLESSLAPALALAEDAPLAVATLGDVFDEKAARIGDLEARLQALIDATERLSRPETLAKLRTMVDLVEDAPAMVATLGDAFDELMDEAEAGGLDLSRVVTDGRGLLFGLLKLTTTPELQAMLAPRAIESLGELARVLVVARERPAPRVGLFGALRAMRDEDVQRALGFLLEVAAGLGRALEVPRDGAPERLPAGGARGDVKERP